MEVAGYTALSRQQSLLIEMDLIANNIANANTTGFRQQGLIFSEFIRMADGDESVAMSAARVRKTSFAAGSIEPTGGTYDLAIHGPGFFLVQTPNGERLTRAGVFLPDGTGTLVTPDGYPVLDPGGAPITVPPDAAQVAIAQDGTISADGAAVGQIGVVAPPDQENLVREGSVLFRADEGFDALEAPRVMQGFVESSNVDPILQVSRMVQVQRSYEMAQNFMQREDERIRAAVNALME